VVGLFLPCLLLVLGLAGCEAPAPPEEPEPQPLEIGGKFDEKTTGTISGRVVWSSTVPQSPPFNVALPVPGGGTQSQLVPNPNTPKINAQTGAVAAAVVYLEELDPERAKPWNLAPVRVETRALAVRILQGDTVVPVGFVRQGEEIEMVSREAVMQSLCVRGAAFFSLSFPDPDRPLRRRLNEPGLVELSSGMGHYWWRGYLFVCRHPYFTWTDADGRFTLTQVPAGDVRVVCWLPNPKCAPERDPNTIGILRVSYDKPFERALPIRLEAGDDKQLEIRMNLD